MYKLIEQASVETNSSSIQIYYRKKVTVPNTPDLLKLINKLVSGMNDNSFEEILNQNNIIKRLLENEFIYHYNATYKNTPQDRQEYFLSQLSSESATDYQMRLHNSSILVIGVGGIGSVLIEQLVGMGIRNYVLVDFDVVDISNLNRQFIYTLNDVGKPKLPIVKQYILDRIPNATIHLVDIKIETTEQIQSLLSTYPIDVIVNAADTPNNIETLISQSTQKIPIVTGGVGFDFGIARILPDNHAKVSVTKRSLLHPQRTPIASFGPTNTIIASLMAIQVFHLVTKSLSENDKKLIIDFLNFNVYTNANERGNNS